MAKSDQPITIKKYANRRLYNTGTSTYVTLEDLAAMVKAGEDFLVHDAKTGEDITRQVLAQIIFEQENKEGQSLLPIAFLRQLIRFYGDSMQMLVPRYLEVSIDSLTREQEKFRQQMAQAFGGSPFGALEDQVRRNMEMFERAFAMFTPFARRARDMAGAEIERSSRQPGGGGEEIHDLKRQMEEMQKRLERLTDKDKGVAPEVSIRARSRPCADRNADQHAAFPVDADRLSAAPRGYGEFHVMAARAQAVDRRCRPRPPRSVSHEERARCVDRRLHVHAVVDQIGDELRMPHRLVVRAHDAEDQVAAAATDAERGDDGVQRPLAGTERVGMVGIEHEAGAAVGQHDAGFSVQIPTPNGGRAC